MNRIPKNLMVSVIMLCLLLGSFLPVMTVKAATGPVCYVDVAATDSNNGNSWANAYISLQSALGDANCTKIWVAAGTYKPTSGADRTATFQLVSGVAVYGGFAGTENLLTQRKPTTNITILSGDIGVSGTNSDNSYHIVTGSSTDVTAMLDGFTITDGNANAPSITLKQDRGGGIFNNAGSPTLVNIQITGNAANNYGGGIYNENSSKPSLSNVTIENNNAGRGGGMHNTYSSSPVLSNVIFRNNQAVLDYGGGIYNNGGNQTLTNVVFDGNSANQSGGGVYNEGGSSPTLIDVTFNNNTAKNGGGLYNEISSSPSLTNVTFSNNSAIAVGGGMYTTGGSPSITNTTFHSNSASWGGGLAIFGSLPTLTNTTFSENVASSGGGGVYNSDSNTIIRNSILWGNTGGQIGIASGAPTITNSVVQGGYSESNISTDPKLGTLGNYGGSTKTIPLLIGSSAIDAGNDATCATADQRGVTRPQRGACDIGAYEYDDPYTGIYYAKPVASGSGNCQGWVNACTLQEALSIAYASGDEIWVAAGTHKPTSDTTDRTATFQLEDGVGVYGGFAGTETLRTQRGPVANVTILSGDIDNNDSQSPITDLSTVTGNVTNSYHVVTGATGATLDGFTITAGYANGTSPNDSGGGMYADSGDSILTNVIFEGNYAIMGGGIYIAKGSTLNLADSTISKNTARFGGGLINSGTLTVRYSTFSDNSAFQGAGIYNGQPGANLLITNSTFYNNNASNDGGGILNYLSTMTVKNSTFLKNSSGDNGNDLYNGQSTLHYTNNILASTVAGQNCYNYFGTIGTNIKNLVLSNYSCGSPALAANPKLGTFGDYGGFTQTIPLLPGSSTIDAGDNVTCAATDQRGVTRPQRGACDIGAYEYDYTGIYYVKPAASGTGDCQSWANACTLRDALKTAISGDEIWAAAGTHKPTSDTTDRTATFQLKDGVGVYGGFTGTETLRTQRDPVANVTILSGDIDNNDTNIDGNFIAETYNNIQGLNSYQVVEGASNVTLDGFTITAGQANGTGRDSGAGIYNDAISGSTYSNLVFSGNYAMKYGGGMFNDNASSLTISNVTFTGNFADLHGGGLHNAHASAPTILDSTFSQNTAGQLGGGMYGNAGIPHISNTIFDSNSAGEGGGMYNDGSSPVLTDVVFKNNHAGFGGGLKNESATNPTLTNVTFDMNTATDFGGGMINNTSNPDLKNVTFNANSADYGGGIYNVDSSNPTLTNVTFKGNIASVAGGGLSTHISSDATIQNTIFWGNTAPSNAQVYNGSGGSSNLTNSVVQDGCPAGSICSMIITADPKLGTLGDYGGFTQTIPLLPGSSAIDSGICISAAPTDQHGVTRPQGGKCDIGAFEVSVIYAKPGGSTSGTCDSWANACELRYALSSSITNNEIWVAAGTYKPTSGTDRTATFQLKSGMAVYGGFAGTETLRTERDQAANVTVLSGDIGGTGTTDNSYHVVTGASNATIDGFIIMAGNAAGAPTSDGGGMLNISSSPTLLNIIFRNNMASSGAGMANRSNSSPSLTNVTFENNVATWEGGGMLNHTNSMPTLTNVTFKNNSAVNGGGIANVTNGAPILLNVTFDSNSAVQYDGYINTIGISDGGNGGGIYNYYSSPTLTNVTFSNNSAYLQADTTFSDPIDVGGTGGGMYNTHSNPVLTNVTFSGNSAKLLCDDWQTSWGLCISWTGAPHIGGNGGGMYNQGSSPTLKNTTFYNNTVQIEPGGTGGNGGGMWNGGLFVEDISSPNIKNSILWANSPHQIFNDPLSTSSTAFVTYSVVQGGYSGTGNIATDPKLGALGNYGGYTQTIPLLSGSSGFDAGNNATCATTDQRGVARPQGAKCDIGAFEVTAGENILTVTIDKAPGQLDPTNTSPVQFAIQFSSAVTDFKEDYVSVSGISGLKAFSMSTADNKTFIVSVSDLATQDILTIADIPAGVVSNSLGNANDASTSIDKTIEVDKTLPGVTINQLAAQPDPTNTNPIRFQVIFSKPVTGFTSSDVSLAGSTANLKNASISVSGSGASYVVSVTGITGTGTVLANIPAGSAKDAAGNLTIASSSTDNSVIFDNVAPTATIAPSSGQLNVSNSLPISFTVVFSEPVEGFTAAGVDFSKGTAQVANYSLTDSGNGYTLTINNASGGTIVPFIKAGSAKDAAGNTNLASDTAQVIVPNTQITSMPATITQDINVVFSFSDVSQVPAGSLTYECELDQETYKQCPLSFPVSPGRHTFKIWSVDKKGKPESSPAIYTWNVVKELLANRLFNEALGATNWTPVNINRLTDKRVSLLSNWVWKFGAGSKTKYLSQNVTPNQPGQSGDTLIFKLKSKAQNVSATRGYYRAEICFYDKTNQRIEPCQILNFSTGTHNWQTVTRTFLAPTDYGKIEARIIFIKPSGTAWFDDASLLWMPATQSQTGGQ
jgi:hypothetical protein